MSPISFGVVEVDKYSTTDGTNTRFQFDFRTGQTQAQQASNTESKSCGEEQAQENVPVVHVAEEDWVAVMCTNEKWYLAKVLDTEYPRVKVSFMETIGENR